jgi:hypothetical protein
MAVETLDAVIAYVVAMVELDGLLENGELIRIVRSTDVQHRPHDGACGDRDECDEDGSIDAVRP